MLVAALVMTMMIMYEAASPYLTEREREQLREEGGPGEGGDSTPAAIHTDIRTGKIEYL